MLTLVLGDARILQPTDERMIGQAAMNEGRTAPMEPTDEDEPITSDHLFGETAGRLLLRSPGLGRLVSLHVCASSD